MQLKATLDQIYRMSMDLATTRSLLDAEAQVRRQQDAGGASTSKGHNTPTQWSMLQGKKTPSMISCRKAPSRGLSISLPRQEGTDDSAHSSSSQDSGDGSRKWRFFYIGKDHS